MSGVAHNPAIVPPGAVRAPDPAAPAAGPRPSGGAFAEVLRGYVGTLRFSGHALQRLERRGIQVGPETLQRLESGVARAAGKGSRESVVLVDGTAYVVSVRNRTVITAVGPEHMREHVFTNIDSAVIA